MAGDPMEETSWREASWRRNRRGDIVEEAFGGGIWSRHHGVDVMEKTVVYSSSLQFTLVYASLLYFTLACSSAPNFIPVRSTLF